MAQFAPVVCIWLFSLLYVFLTSSKLPNWVSLSFHVAALAIVLDSMSIILTEDLAASWESIPFSLLGWYATVLPATVRNFRLYQKRQMFWHSLVSLFCIFLACYVTFVELYISFSGANESSTNKILDILSDIAGCGFLVILNLVTIFHATKGAGGADINYSKFRQIFLIAVNMACFFTSELLSFLAPDEYEISHLMAKSILIWEALSVYEFGRSILAISKERVSSK